MSYISLVATEWSEPFIYVGLECFNLFFKFISSNAYRIAYAVSYAYVRRSFAGQLIGASLSEPHIDELNVRNLYILLLLLL